MEFKEIKISELREGRNYYDTNKQSGSILNFVRGKNGYLFFVEVVDRTGYKKLTRKECKDLDIPYTKDLIMFSENSKLPFFEKIII